MRAIARVTGVSFNTVDKLLEDAGLLAMSFHDEKVRHLQSKQLQCDEIWSFCYAKRRNAPEALKATGDAGDVWTYTALDRDTKLIATWLVGDRTRESTNLFVGDLADRVDSAPQITTDAANPYINAMVGYFEDRGSYAQLDKIYSNSPDKGPDRKYSPGVCVGTKKKVRFGNPDKAMISTSHVERANLTMRMSMRRFTRLTNGFSKRMDNHCHALALYFFWYNWVRPHASLHKATPAMAAGLTDAPMSMNDMAEMIDAANPPKARGPDRKTVNGISN
ncbi:MAG TPA: IS1 family transposase [Rhizomicrobium sp.]|nr:IS1 family transposase [Rhizomicrobium sp.]